MIDILMFITVFVEYHKGWTIRKLMGGGGGGEVPKKYSRKAKLNEKNACTPINPKKYSCYGLKNIHTRNLITKKNSCGSKIPHPPHSFSNGPSLRVEMSFRYLEVSGKFSKCGNI